MTRTIGMICILSASLAWVGCGGSGGQAPPPPPPPPQLHISPQSATVDQGATQGFTANIAVNWSVEEGQAGGSVSSNGMYTAPMTAGVFHVVAISKTDPPASVAVAVTVNPIQVAVAPAAITVGPGSARSFSAFVSGAANTAVLWSVQEGAGGGAVDANGDYVSPVAPGTYHVLATSAVDAGAVASATVTVTSSGFSNLGDMTVARGAHTASLLGDGTVLVTGGFDATGAALASAEIFDPATKTFTAIGKTMAVPRTFHTATVLNDGTVLLAGGGVSATDTSAEIYDPVAKTFTLLAASMTTQRNAFTATLLPDGRVLLAGGSDNSGTTLASTAEIYDPSTQTFTPTAGVMSYARYDHAATLLNDGKVLITGGFSDTFGTGLNVAELFDPATGTFTVTNPMVDARGYHSASLLANGSVLVAGGMEVVSDDWGGTTVFHQDSELFDGNSTFLSGSPMLEARAAHTATQLTDGTILFVGGFSLISDPVPQSVELYDPASSAFGATGSLAHGRYFHGATRLNSGDVLITGGFDSSNTALASAELYH